MWPGVRVRARAHVQTILRVSRPRDVHISNSVPTPRRSVIQGEVRCGAKTPNFDGWLKTSNHSIPSSYLSSGVVSRGLYEEIRDGRFSSPRHVPSAVFVLELDHFWNSQKDCRAALLKWWNSRIAKTFARLPVARAVFIFSGGPIDTDGKPCMSVKNLVVPLISLPLPMTSRTPE